MELTVDQVEQICDNMGIEYSSFTNTYSGRGMYGKHCIGWTIDTLAEMMTLAICFRDVMDEADAIRMSENARTDNMGLSYIVYFPDDTCPEWDEEQFEEDYDDDDY